jgi:uncharacterized membrane protein YoaK (UPF0700 family)
MQIEMARGASSLPESIFRSAKHGPLPALLFGLTLITGLVDAISLLSLGRVFVANMTGNVVFIGLAAAGAPAFSIAASLIALAGFLIGALVGGRLIGLVKNDRGQLLARACLLQLALMAGSLTVVIATDLSTNDVRYSVAAILAAAMGIQNAVVRRIAVPNLTTTVLTLTLTGLAADLRETGWRALQQHHRLLAVVTMLIGATIGAVLIIQINTEVALAVAVVVMGMITIGSLFANRRPATWRKTV